MLKVVSLVAVVLAGAFLGIGSAHAQDSGQTVTTQGLTAYFGVVPAAIARGVARSHGEADLHGAGASGQPSYHLLVAIFDAATGDRISDATVAATVTRSGREPQSKALEPMAIADTVTYGNFFELPTGATYRILLAVTKKGDTTPTEIEFTYDQDFR